MIAPRLALLLIVVAYRAVSRFWLESRRASTTMMPRDAARTIASLYAW
jgi:hypothetical protein